MIKSEYVRIYKSIHTWTGILSGLALFIAFYAGALTVFKEPLARWAAPPSEIKQMPLANAQQLTVKTLAIHREAARDFTLYLGDAENIPARMGWQSGEPDSDEHDEAHLKQYAAMLDKQDAPVVLEVQPSRLADFIDVLHRVVGLPVDNDPNRLVMGIIAVLYSLALISGVIVLLPSLIKDFFALRVGKNLKRMWLDAHNIVGIVSLPFHIIMALTAVVFAFHDDIYRIQDALIHNGKWSTAFQRPKIAKANTPPRDPATMLPPEALLSQIHKIAPDFQASMLQYQQITGPHPVVRIWGKDEGTISPRARGGFAAIDPYSGKITNKDFLPGQQDTPNLLISSFFALHMAAFGGAAVQWMYFLLGLAGAWLFYSGNLLWIESRRKKLPRQGGPLPQQRLDTRLMASATVGVCFGSISGISLAIAGSKWLYGLVGDLNAWHPVLYYGTFFACLAWAFVFGAGKTAVHLSGLASLTTLAIPLTSLIAWSIPSLGMWTHLSAASLGVDLTALVGGLLLAWISRIAWSRARQGSADSVWSIAKNGDIAT